MKPDDIILGQFYVIEDNTGDEELERFLQGTNRVVKIVRRADYTSKRFIAEHYGFPINSEWIKCWVPGVGELAEFSDDGKDWTSPRECAGYFPAHYTRHPFRLPYGEFFRYARPVQKKAEPAPDRNRTFEPAELEAMQEEAMLESIENHKPEITVVPDPEQPRYAALKKRLTRLERFMADNLHKNTGGANMLVLLQELTVRLEALEAKDDWREAMEKRIEALETNIIITREDVKNVIAKGWHRATGGMIDDDELNIITEEVFSLFNNEMFSRPLYAINPNPFYVNTPDRDKAI